MSPEDLKAIKERAENVVAELPRKGQGRTVADPVKQGERVATFIDGIGPPLEQIREDYADHPNLVQKDVVALIDAHLELIDETVSLRERVLLSEQREKDAWRAIGWMLTENGGPFRISRLSLLRAPNEPAIIRTDELDGTLTIALATTQASGEGER